MRVTRKRARLVALAGTGALLVAAQAPSTPEGGVTVLRRLSESEYRHAVADVFGPQVKVTARFEPEVRRDGLLALGASGATISAAGFEQYYAMARSVADQALAPASRAAVAPCAPASPKTPDDACVRQVVQTLAPRLLRRPATREEVDARVALARDVAARSRDFDAGLKAALVSLMVSPEFLFRVEDAGADGAMTPYAKASRLSFFLWDTAPDAPLLAAAASGALDTPAGLGAQVDRMLASPRLEQGLRAFLTDMLQLDGFDNLNKDASIYPKYSALVARSAKEETLRASVDLLLTRDGDYRDLFTTRRTFLNRSLASVYQAPYTFGAEWEPYEFPKDSGRSGLLTQVTFLSLFSHPGRTSPTKRGVALYEIFLCDPTPSPPANVDFSIVNNTADPKLKTVRARLLAHATDETCASCHTHSDPAGLALERFDSLGQRRLIENGEPIDVAAEIDGKPLVGAEGLGMVLRDNPRVAACLVSDLYAYGRGRVAARVEKPVLARLSGDFAKDGYRLRPLLRRIATDSGFFTLPAHPAAAPPVTKASAASPPPARG